jgi:hypothetical protein
MPVVELSWAVSDSGDGGCLTVVCGLSIAPMHVVIGATYFNGALHAHKPRISITAVQCACYAQRCPLRPA